MRALKNVANIRIDLKLDIVLLKKKGFESYHWKSIVFFVFITYTYR